MQFIRSFLVENLGSVDPIKSRNKNSRAKSVSRETHGEWFQDTLYIWFKFRLKVTCFARQVLMRPGYASFYFAAVISRLCTGRRNRPAQSAGLSSCGNVYRIAHFSCTDHVRYLDDSCQLECRDVATLRAAL